MSSRTVYIFGAGASKHAGYPLVSEMGRQWLEWMANYPGGRYRGSIDLLNELFGAAPNIEDVITELESSIDSLADSEGLEHRLRRALLGNTRGQLSESLREWFRELHLNPASAYAQFAERVSKAGDVIISFNYDDSLDRELRRVGKWNLEDDYGESSSGRSRSNCFTTRL